MWHKIDVVRFGQGGDLHRLGEATDITDVDAGELGDSSSGRLLRKALLGASVPVRPAVSFMPITSW